MAAIKGALTEAGLLAFVVENRIHVVPPCTITAEQVAQGLAILMRSSLALPVWRSREGPDNVTRQYACRAYGCEPVSGSCRPGGAAATRRNQDTVPDILPGGAALAGPTGVSL